MKTDINLAIVGLGYVGLPLAVEFAKTRKVLGFDINSSRVNDLKCGQDITLEVSEMELSSLDKLQFSCNEDDLSDINTYIVTVPTPIDECNNPDLSPLKAASKLIGKFIKPNDIVIYESTVYPGATEEICVPILEQSSNLKFNEDFFVGYSPERINPGDKINTVQNIKKIVSFDDCPLSIKKKITKIYSSISNKIIFTKSIEQAEMSKVIENIQRDINVAFMNEIFMVCEKLNLNFKEVIKLASTKWNFLNFSPGLVGGHCLPVDPFYLHHLAKVKGHDAKFMLAGRIVNDDLKKIILKKIQKEIIKRKLKKILILGLTYKANVSDIRNSLALDIFIELKKKFKNKIFAYDPVLNIEFSKKIKLLKRLNLNNYDLIVPLLNHEIFKKKISKHFKQNIQKYMDIFNHFS